MGCGVPAAATADSSGTAASSGGTQYGAPPKPPFHPTVPGVRAKLVRGVAYAPAAAPLPVQMAIWAGNRLRHKRYRYGGGHRSFRDRAYDCSGTVSYALHGGGLLSSPLDSSSFLHWGIRGRGLWMTVYTNPGHAYLVIAGLRLDTSGPGERGPRWRARKSSNRGYKSRHPVGF